MENEKDSVEIDLLQLVKALWHRVWAIILAMLVMGALVFSYTKLLVTPMYKASTLLYVNNNTSSGSHSGGINSSDLAVAQRLVETYKVILQTRETMDAVIAKANLPYTFDELSKMVSVAAVNDTEMFSVTVTDPNPQEAKLIADTIGEVLPGRIATVMDGSSARIADTAKLPTKPSSPHTMKNTVLGMLVGAVVACAVIIIQTLTDKKVHDTDYLLNTYDLPVLAVIPELIVSDQKHSRGSYGGRQGGM